MVFFQMLGRGYNLHKNKVLNKEHSNSYLSFTAFILHIYYVGQLQA